MSEQPCNESMLVRLHEACVAVASTHYRNLPGWLEGVSPLIGHCVTVALMAQGMFGGDVLKGSFNNYPHYWNRLPDGREVDLTSCQFGGDGINPVTFGRKVDIDADCGNRLVAVLFAQRVQEHLQSTPKRITDLATGRVPSHPNGVPPQTREKKPRKRKDRR